MKLLKLLYKYKLLLIISCILAVSISSFVSVKYVKNKYRATTVMIISSLKNSISNDNISNNDYTLNVNLVNSYRILCKTDYILNKVLKNIHQPLSIAQLSAKITVNSVNDTDIIRINAEDNDPYLAALIANCTAQVFENEIPVIMKMDNVQIIDTAPVPLYPFSPNRKAIVVLSLIGSLIFCSIIIVLCEYLDVTIKSESQLENFLQVPVLCSMPHTKTVLGKNSTV